ncbi:hypothetical protein Ancab_039212 [Ancistrocladus abbreviatus]
MGVIWGRYRGCQRDVFGSTKSKVEFCDFVPIQHLVLFLLCSPICCFSLPPVLSHLPAMIHMGRTRPLNFLANNGKILADIIQARDWKFVVRNSQDNNLGEEELGLSHLPHFRPLSHSLSSNKAPLCHVEKRSF